MFGTRKSSARRRPFTVLSLESLEERALLHAGPLEGLGEHAEDAAQLAYYPNLEINTNLPAAPSATTGLAPAGALHPLAAIPVLNSLLGAAATLYLDFDGHFEARWGSYSNITTPVYDQDGDAASFSDGELGSIRQIWQYVAEDYSPFNINVTTVAPPSFADGVALRISIGGSGSWLGNYGGVSYLDSFTNSIVNTSYVFPDHLAKGTPKYVAEAASHEAGHAFGLQHQSQYDADGKKLAEYYAGPGDGAAPIMGNSYHADRGLWWYGASAVSSVSYQDDMSVIARSTNRFGYRPDDYGNTVYSATTLTTLGNTIGASGVIATAADVDYFAFSTGAGAIRLTVGVAVGFNDLDARLELHDAAGNLLAAADPSDSYGATLTLTVAAGSYRAAVVSHGGYGDVGQYSFTGTIVPINSNVDAAAKLTVKSVTAKQVNLQWNDYAKSETGYAVERSIDGVNWTQLAALKANVTQFADTATAPGASFYYRVRAFNATATLGFSNAVGATIAPTAPLGLVAVAVSSTRIDLSWSDVAGETGYRIERSVDGVNFVQVGATPMDLVTISSADLAANKTYYFRAAAVNGGGSSAYSNIAVAVTLPTPVTLLAPSNVTAKAISANRVALTWQDNAKNEVGYLVDRSTDGGKTWKLVGILYPNNTSFIDSSVARSKTYLYRVSAFDRRVLASGNLVSVTTPRS